ncbi:Acetylene hydratase [Sporomusa silvacetica DSM 10669]|uniref:Acetylene hydratase n=1 Tax=Sporomusa silvacetica DSM 10669 TaxID=1123289 RepID=A0ABZ3IHK7_9FIRM|nr:molybdopterin-dependent oxidoreductase [Sporomusa silvacetica]OZC13088.1 acetylene hydratase [Sporomusa silvacetica DSM 10669]
MTKPAEYHLPLEWQEGEYTVYRNHHWSGPGCHNACAILVYVKDGKVAKVEGDPESPYNQGRLCMRCLNMVEAYYHSDRIKWPLKRVGARGENKWERISWDEAYNIIEEKVTAIKKEYGPEAIVCMEGTGRNVNWQVPMMAYSVFGTPNFGLGFLSGDACYLPRCAAMYAQMGDATIADMSQQFEKRYDDPNWKCPEVVLIWGNNPLVSNGDGFLGHWIVDVMKMGAKLIVIDPEATWLASRAEYFLQIRPGTDGALALGMLNVIINEELYDKEFVEKWTYGFDELKERVQEWPVEKVAEITWIPADLIKNAARFFAKASPAALQWGLPIDMHPTGITTAVAISTISSICGNFDVPGGNIVARQGRNIAIGYMTGAEFISEELWAKHLVPKDTPMHNQGVMGTAQGDAILEALETNTPYTVKMLWFQSTNPIACMGAEAPRIYNAIQKPDFNVVVDLFMTPTAVACADLVLPCAMGNERNSVRPWWFPVRAINKITEYEECKSDEELLVELGNRLNPELFKEMGWKKDTDLLTWICNVINPEWNWPEKWDATFEELQKQHISFDNWSYRKHETGLLRTDGEPGFNTPTGKLECSCLALDSFDVDPLPYWEEPPESPVSTPVLAKEYPFVLTTGRRSWEFFHSEHRQLPTMREFHPDPLVTINTETAAKMGIQEGDWVWVENMRGRMRQRAKLKPTMHPNVISAEHAWWFPEQKGENLFGVFDSNANNLTKMGQYGPTGYGAPYKCTICKIYKGTEENSKVMPTEEVIKKGGFGYVK